ILTPQRFRSATRLPMELVSLSINPSLHPAFGNLPTNADLTVKVQTVIAGVVHAVLRQLQVLFTCGTVFHLIKSASITTEPSPHRIEHGSNRSSLFSSSCPSMTTLNSGDSP